MIYWREGKLLAESGQVRVYEYNKELFLEIGQGHTLWTLESELAEYKKQLTDKPFGNVLEIGLGLGVASRFILSLSDVETLTTIELNMDVIKVHKEVSKIRKGSEKQHTIINDSGLHHICTTENKYDFIFLDFYEIIDEETLPLIADIVNNSKRILNINGKIMGWFDPFTPDEFVEEFYDLF